MDWTLCNGDTHNCCNYLTLGTPVHWKSLRDLFNTYGRACDFYFFSHAIMCLPGKKQDLWHVVDLLTGEKQQTLTSSFAEMLCPSSSLLYLGRTGKAAPRAELVLKLAIPVNGHIYIYFKLAHPI